MVASKSRIAQVAPEKREVTGSTPVPTTLPGDASSGLA